MKFSVISLQFSVKAGPAIYMMAVWDRFGLTEARAGD